MHDSITLETDRKKDLTQRIKGFLQNSLISDWNVAVDTDSVLQQDGCEPLSHLAPASGGTSTSWSAKTSGIITVKTIGETLYGNSHVSKLRSLQSNLRMQEVSNIVLELEQAVLHRAMDVDGKKMLVKARDEGEPICK